MTEVMEHALDALRQLPVEKLPRVLGMLAEIQETARARLTASAPAPAADELLTVAQAANQLQCSTATLCKREFPFVRRLGRKRLYSSRGIDEYLKSQK